LDGLSPRFYLHYKGVTASTCASPPDFTSEDRLALQASFLWCCESPVPSPALSAVTPSHLSLHRFLKTVSTAPFAAIFLLEERVRPNLLIAVSIRPLSQGRTGLHPVRHCYKTCPPRFSLLLPEILCSRSPLSTPPQHSRPAYEPMIDDLSLPLTSSSHLLLPQSRPFPAAFR